MAQRRTRSPTWIDQRTQEEILEDMMERFDEVNALYIAKVAAQIQTIGELNAASMHRIEVMARMNADIAEINSRLADAVQINRRDLLRLYDRALNDMYRSPNFERALRETPLPDIEKRRLNNLAQMIARQTAGTMQNLSNTTAVSETYRQIVDKAILTNVTGMGSYKEAMRDSIRDLGRNGMQVQYASGHRRRLDTAIRQNIIDGSNQIAQHGSDMMGEALGFDGYELSAHAASAPDHEPVQGRVFLKDQFELMQAGLPFTDIDGRWYEGFRRPIGEWNCMHFAMSFDTQRSVRRYTDAQLRDWAQRNRDGCNIDGKQYTLYQARQLMRRIETEVRRQKDTATAARGAGDRELQERCQRRINALMGRYYKVAKTSGFRPRPDRTTVQGFKAVKVS